MVTPPILPEQTMQRRDELDELYRPDEGAATGAFSRLCDTASGLLDRSELPKLILHTDERPRLQQLIGKNRFLHHPVNSDHPRVPGGPLFSVEYIDREFRKDLAHHNFKKVYRIRQERSDLRTHAEIAGATEADAKEAWSS